MACGIDEPIVLAGGDGKRTPVYVAIKKLVAADGPLTATPVVTSSDVTKLTVGSVTIGAAPKTFGGETHAAGEWFKFRATAVGSYVGDVSVSIDYETSEREETKCVTIRRVTCS
jgi:GTP:adenosylcobinamide-phosphate guanylyltransferase